MTTSIQPRENVFPGYQLTERIGSGGYAEVWRARAPGGIDKAVKIVYGCYDEQLAVQELKAMERIKDVRHPFVLSLERFEIVDGRLAILTELADMSLEQRAQQCRAQGLSGIPRDELLGFMSDTAEALDYLAERHSLQHLDIKPANLLISGDHVKVADFGLVKELASRTQNSMVAGMTPTYSSPEMFDDAPSPQSDQYSLAIVYQEMLTGVLPFPGRTAAQLSNQHLRSQPQLAALAEIDRPVVARALAKNPAERFPSCRAFVKALVEAAEPPAKRAAANKASEQHRHDNSDTPVTTMPRGAKGVPPASPSVSEAKASQSTEVQPHKLIDTKSDLKLAANVRPKEDIVDVATPDVATAIDTKRPTLYIAVGGVGIRILNRLRDLLARREQTPQQSLATEMIAIDTDRAELKDACSAKWSNPLPSPDALCLALKLPQEYRDQERLNLEWLSHRWLYNIPRSLETRGYRSLGRLALVDHADRALSLIDQKLDQLTTIGAGGEDQPEPAEIRVVLLVGMGGGTGGGMAIDLANAARSRLHNLGRRAQVQGVFVCSCLGNTSASPLSIANTYALLTELQFVSAFGNQAARGESSSLPQLESRNRPFDLVYCVKTKHRADESADDGLGLIAKQMSLASTDGVRQMLECCQQTATPKELVGQDALLLRTFGSASLVGPKQNRINRLARYLARAIEQHWMGNAGSSEWRRLDRTSDAESSLQSPSLQSDSAEGSKVAPIPCRSQAEEWRHRFGEHASTRFTYEVVSRICRQSALRGVCRTTLLSSTDPARLVEFASQAVSSICKRAAESPKLGDPLSDEDEIIVNKLASSGNHVLTKLIDEIERQSADSSFEAAKMDRIIMAECVATIQECLGQHSTGVAIDQNSTLQTDAQQALDRVDVDLLQCGHDRRTLIIVPSSNKATEAVDALTKARPTAAVVSAEVDESVVFCEGSGISPASLARGFERVYPGIAEAARRLFTRIDIDWSAWTL
jgi:serine/threonine protein kinase